MASQSEDFVSKYSLLGPLKISKYTIPDTIQKINHIKALELGQKTQIAAQVDYDGYDGLILASQYLPLVLPAYMGLVSSLLPAAQDQIFERARLYCRSISDPKNAKNIPGMLQLLEVLPKPFQITIFKETKVLISVIQYEPRYVLEALDLIKKFDVTVQEDIFKQTVGNANALMWILYSKLKTAFFAALKLINNFNVITKGDIFGQKDQADINVLMYVAIYAPQQAPELFSILLKSIKEWNLPVKEIEKIFITKNKYQNVLVYLLKYGPKVFLEALDLIKKLDRVKREALFEFPNFQGNNALMCMAEHAPDAFLAALELTSDFDLRVKEKIFTQENYLHQNMLLRIAEHARKLLPAFFKFVRTLPRAIQETMFSCMYNPLVFLAIYSPQDVSAALELIQDHSIRSKSALFATNQPPSSLVNMLMYLAQKTPKAFPVALRIVKKLPKKISEKIIKQKDYIGAGLEFYIVAGGDTEVLKSALAMGLIFNKNAIDNSGHGLLYQAAKHGQADMLKELISEYGLNPNIRAAEQPVHNRIIDLWNNTALLNSLYAIYLNSLHPFIMDYTIAEVNQSKLGKLLPPELVSIIAAYLLNDPTKENALEAQEPFKKSIEAALELRKQLLKPLSDYCEQSTLDLAAKSVLTKLLASKKLNLQVLEEALDLLLKNEELSEEPYVQSLIKCRLNIAEITENAPDLSGRNQKILEDVKLELKKQEYSVFQYKVLCICTAISAPTLILGIIAICMFHPIALIATAIAATAASTLVLGVSAHGFYSRRKNTDTPNDDPLDRIPTPIK